ncbi:ABC1 kinase family protein [Candidatus Azoamicus ciliaticola]|uniref:Protein kinase domain-containing protein n=1 Tax=Candidatus Azoamicus ciliaticola TaxID=2652803 RepID=A0A6J5JZ09_9GAMM|nr:AarF/UbiB family protein [Candidatus Azoamicus ciliaticola]CAB3976250.1 putative protein kinase UbiB [Candidatus Azoamicus ciliaticola]
MNLIKKIYSISKIITLILILKKSSNVKEKKETAQKITNLIEKLGPIAIKLGQILSTRIDLLPEELINELKKLQTNIKPIKFKKIKNIIEKKFNAKLNSMFKKINENPLASASIAQIHTALSKKNEKLVIKIIKPEIKNTIKKDLILLKFFSIIIHIIFPKIRRLKPIDIIKELDKSLKTEINLKNEAINIIKTQKNFKNNNKIYIPKIDITLTNDEIITLEYIDGINITNKEKFTKIKLNTKIIVTNLLELLYTQIFKHNLFHADLHPGNILISKNKSNKSVIVLIDFGISSTIRTKEKIYLAKNLLAFAQKDYKNVAKLHLKSQTINTKKTIQEIENDLYFIFEPILNKKIEKISFKNTISLLINLSRSLNMQMQPQLILFQKTLLSIESISRHIEPSINLWKITRISLEKIITKNTLTEKIKKIFKNKKNNKEKIKNKNNYNMKPIPLIITYLIIILINNIMKYKMII